MSEIGDWFKSLPPFTRWWFGLSVAIPLLGRLGVVNSLNMILLYEPLVYKFQIWRPFTALFYYPITPMNGFHYLTNLYFLYNYSLRLETGSFEGRPADYFFMLLFLWLCSVIIGLIADLYLLMDPMVLSVLYVWCQLNKNMVVSFWFGTQFRAMYLPWIVLIFNFVITGSFLIELVGILIGHLYFFFKFKYPLDFGGPSCLNTPSFLYRYFPSRPGFGGFGQAPSNRQQQPPPNNVPGRHQWGQGHVLGGN